VFIGNFFKVFTLDALVWRASFRKMLPLPVSSPVGTILPFFRQILCFTLFIIYKIFMMRQMVFINSNRSMRIFSTIIKGPSLFIQHQIELLVDTPVACSITIDSFFTDANLMAQCTAEGLA
jgi:hypothetical protein